MTNHEPSPEQIVDLVYSYAAEQMHKGVAPAAIERSLVEKGLSETDAASVVSNLNQAWRKAHQEAGERNMLYGALWCVGCIVVTVLTYQAAADGGKFIIAWGAVVFGGIQFCRGLIQVLSN